MGLRRGWAGGALAAWPCSCHWKPSAGREETALSGGENVFCHWPGTMRHHLHFHVVLCEPLAVCWVPEAVESVSGIRGKDQIPAALLFPDGSRAQRAATRGDPLGVTFFLSFFF